MALRNLAVFQDLRPGNRHGYYSETLDSNSTIAELDQRLQTQRVRLQNATDKLHEESKKTGLFRSNPLEVHSLQNKADFEAEVLQDIEDEKNLLSRQQRLKAAPFLMDNMSPDLAQYVLTGQGFETYGELVLPVYRTIF